MESEWANCCLRVISSTRTRSTTVLLYLYIELCQKTVYGGTMTLKKQELMTVWKCF